jgi:hypothetical protein
MYRITVKSPLSHITILLAVIALLGFASVAGASDFAPADRATLTDFDGDNKSDLVFFGPSGSDISLGEWMVRKSSDSSISSIVYGEAGDRPVLGDYDGDRLTDIAVVHEKADQLVWRVVGSSSTMKFEVVWGMHGDVPVPGDYDNDGKTDIAVFRPSDGVWYIMGSGGAMLVTQFGLETDKPVPGDYDGDGQTDIAVWRRQTRAYFVLNSQSDTLLVQEWKPFSRKGKDAVLVPADYDGDGKTDFATFSSNEGLWTILESASGEYRFASIGGGVACASLSEIAVCTPTQFAIPGDFDGDGKVDPAIWISNEGKAHILGSSEGEIKTYINAGAGMMSVSASFTGQ